MNECLPACLLACLSAWMPAHLWCCWPDSHSLSLFRFVSLLFSAISPFPMIHPLLPHLHIRTLAFTFLLTNNALEFHNSPPYRGTIICTVCTWVQSNIASLLKLFTSIDKSIYFQGPLTKVKQNYVGLTLHVMGAEESDMRLEWLSSCEYTCALKFCDRQSKWMGVHPPPPSPHLRICMLKLGFSRGNWQVTHTERARFSHGWTRPRDSKMDI